jgi:ABC-type nitrate/sulfonate/bicarbonate transport system ATPase subunit
MAIDALAASSASAITITGLGYRYPKADRNVLGGLQLQVPVGQHVALIGRSGCGKSTLLSLIAGLHQPTTGAISVLGHDDPAGRLACCAIMPQGDSLLPWLNLLDNVAIGLRNRGVQRQPARARAHATLNQWGLADWEQERPAALSGGMRQRAALARALLADKPILLADEPLGALDAITRAEIQQWLRATIIGSSATLIMVTHDVDEALLLSHRVVLLAEPAPGQPVSTAASWPGWFADDRPRELLLGDPAFATVRRQILQSFADSGSGPNPGAPR